MSTLTVTNLTASRLPTNQYVGTLKPNEVRTLSLSANELELSKDVLLALQDEGLLSFSTAPSSTNADNALEPVLGGAVVRAGVGSPAGIVSGNPGDLYVNKSGGANTTLYVKESGAGTTAGWVAK